MRDEGLPAAFRGRTDLEDVVADVEAARGTTVADRARILESLCRMAAEQIAQHPDPQKVFDWQDPLSAEARRLLERLRAQWGGRGRDRERA